MTTNNLPAASSATQVTQTFEEWWKVSGEDKGFFVREDTARLSWQTALAHSPEVAKLKETLCWTVNQLQNAEEKLRAASPSVSPAPVSPSLKEMQDAAEMLWVVLANVSGGDWTLQSDEWQKYAAQWRDNYFKVFHPKQEDHARPAFPEPPIVDVESEAEAGKPQRLIGNPASTPEEKRVEELFNRELPASSPSEGVSSVCTIKDVEALRFFLRHALSASVDGSMALSVHYIKQALSLLVPADTAPKTELGGEK